MIERIIIKLSKTKAGIRFIREREDLRDLMCLSVLSVLKENLAPKVYVYNPSRVIKVRQIEDNIERGILGNNAHNSVICREI